jgi:hypothetical protein
MIQKATGNTSQKALIFASLFLIGASLQALSVSGTFERPDASPCSHVQVKFAAPKASGLAPVTIHTDASGHFNCDLAAGPWLAIIHNFRPFKVQVAQGLSTTAIDLGTLTLKNLH